MKPSTETAIYTTIAALLLIGLMIVLIHFGAGLPWGTTVFAVAVGCALLLGVGSALKSMADSVPAKVPEPELPYGHELQIDPNAPAPAKRYATEPAPEPEKPTRSPLWALAALVAFVGCMLIFTGVNEDTTVPLRNGGSVHNIGLMQEQNQLLIGGGFAIIVAAILAVGASMSKPK